MLIPSETSIDTFGWPVSMAQVANSGPFWLFSGIDRTLSVLEGRGLRLEIAVRSVIEFDTASTLTAIPGDVATTATLVHGLIGNFNVMTRRSRFAQVLERVGSAHGETAKGFSTPSPLLVGRHATSIRFCASGSVNIGLTLVFRNHDALLKDQGAQFESKALEPSIFFYVTLIPVS